MTAELLEETERLLETIAENAYDLSVNPDKEKIDNIINDLIELRGLIG